MIPDVCKHFRACESNLLSVLVRFVSRGIAPAFTVTRSPAWLNQESKKPSKWSTSGIFMFPCPKLEVLYSHSQNWFKGSILQQQSGKRHIMCVYIYGVTHINRITVITLDISWALIGVSKHVPISNLSIVDSEVSPREERDPSAIQFGVQRDSLGTRQCGCLGCLGCLGCRRKWTIHQSAINDFQR
jgi:hypothetical protein